MILGAHSKYYPVKEKDVKKDIKLLCLYANEWKEKAEQAGMKDHFFWRFANKNESEEFRERVVKLVSGLKLGEITHALFYQHKLIKGELDREQEFPYDSEKQISRMQDQIKNVEKDFKERECERGDFQPCWRVEGQKLTSNFSVKGAEELKEKLYFIAGIFSILEEKSEVGDIQFDVRMYIQNPPGE